jgi:CRP/FNR family cyclic AMP-dependent transcriptional regulator
MNESILKFCDSLPTRPLAPGETLIRLGGADNRLYILKQGELEVSKDGVQISLQNEPGAIYGEVSVLLGVPHTADVAAVTAAEVYTVENADAFLRAHPDITFFVSKLLAQRLKSVTDYLVDIKRQFQDEANHLAMVDEVLESLAHQQDEELAPGSDRYPDTAL